MMLGVATPPPTEVGEPTWYLVWDVAGTWAGALFTAAATIVALWLGVKATRDQRIQMEAHDRVQAERVTLRYGRDAINGAYYLELRNDSDLPISQVTVLGEGGFEADLHDVVAVIDAHSTRKFSLRSAYLLDEPAVAEFDDASGRAWIRTVDGKLHRVVRRWRHSALRPEFNDRRVRRIYVTPRPGAVPFPLRWARSGSTPGAPPAGKPPRFLLPLYLPTLVWHTRKAPSKPNYWAIAKQWAEWDLMELKRRRGIRREARRERRRIRRTGIS
jgi:hypothetical protein